uniref:Uncharacterized protein n=1 Tax=Anguilla anguilla TaxID=7936 RepID=A0A0E9PPG6_ANGAN
MPFNGVFYRKSTSQDLKSRRNENLQDIDLRDQGWVAVY